MAAAVFRDRLAALALTQSKAAATWGISADLFSRWATGKVPVPGWMRHALDGIEYDRMKKRATERGYPWPPPGYEDR